MSRTIAVIVIAVVSACALPVAAPAQTASCSQETKRLNTFKRGMKAAKRKYFRTHRSTRARRTFVRKQRQKLARLQRARRRCLATPKPGPAPSPRPAPQPAPQPSPPRFVPQDVVSDAALASPAEISQDGGVDVIRTQLVLDLRSGATAAAVEALLQRLDAQVVSSLHGVGQLTVRIPDPGSLAALDALIANLAGEPVLDRADRAEVPVPDDLPEFILPGDSDVVRPQLAVRAHAAWNARAALAGPARPTLVVGDHFGNGPPGVEVAVGATAADFATGAAHDHGYMILGLAAGAFDPLGLGDIQADRATGLWAGPPLTLRAVDLKRTVAGSTFEDRLVTAIRGTSGNVVLTTSLAAPCAATTGCSLAQATAGALMWIEKIRAFDLEARVLHTTSAGNLRAHLPADTAARFNSEYAGAALLPLSEPNLRNTLVVENAIASPTDVARPLCLRNSSKRGGHIAAIGTDVTSLDAPGSGDFLDDGGTSAATPQVAGAAATVWALDPSLSPSQVITRLLATARPATGTTGDARCAPVTNAPALDAYGAVLAADDTLDAPAREAVLDPVDAGGDEVVPTNGRFDEKDLEAFASAFGAANGDIDYGRYDLNGDGRTGGDTVDRVDLDATAPPEWDFSDRRDVLGLEIGHVETELTDLDVLCHEAAGPLYRGDAEARDQFLEEHCLPPVTLDVAFPNAVEPGQTNTLLIGARRTDVTAPDDALPGVHLDLTVEGGSVDAFTGVTDENGDFSTGARLFAGQPALRIVIVARAGDGGPELASRSVIAQVVTDGTVQVLDELGYLDVGARAIGDGEELSDSDHDEGPSATFSFAGSASASVGGASGSAQAQGTASLVSDGASLTLTTGGRFRGHASADGSTFTQAGAGGTVYAYIEFEITGGPMKFNIIRTPRSNCDTQVHPWDNNSTPTSPLQPGHYYYEGVCFGGAGVEDGSAEFDVETSSELRIFR